MLALYAPATGFAAQDDGLALLRRAASVREIKYVATRRVEVREGGERKVHVERIVRDGRRVRVDFEPGSRFEGQTVVETPGGRTIFDPVRRELRRLPARGEEGERRLVRFVRQIESGALKITVGDGGRIAGRATRRVVISRGDRPLVALSIDPPTAVVLRRESFSPLGGSEDGPAGSYVFTRFEPRSQVAAATFAIPKNGYRVVQPQDDLRELSLMNGFPALALPASSGYRLEGSRIRKTRAATILAAFYVGGGKRLTVFAAKGELPDLPKRGSGNAGASEGVALYRWRVGNVSYGLLGEESPARLRSLAALLSPI